MQWNNWFILFDYFLGRFGAAALEEETNQRGQASEEDKVSRYTKAIIAERLYVFL